MAVSWTKEQQQVIDLSNRDILVSAAAGSGKTAVLVERIIKKITDKKHPVDIDRLLVVTFTNAAAAEMRERIRLAIDGHLAEDPENENLMRQASLIHNAQITTIDSFCLFVVRNHFGEISLDPNFRIADSGELELLKLDTMAEVFEAEYEKCGENKESAFLRLIDAYSGKNSDVAVKNMIAQIYRQSQSQPWPKEWILSLGEGYRVQSVEELFGTPVMCEIVDYVKKVAADCLEQTNNLLEIALAADGPTKYAEALKSDLEFYQALSETSGYQEQYELLSNFKYKSFSAIRNFDGDEAKKNAVSEGRKRLKGIVEELQGKYFSMEPEETVAQFERIRPQVEELIRLSCLYLEAMDEKKRQRRIVDFSDIEHFALKILVDERTKECTATALEFQHQFAEILIDEYQDSNQVQEAILTAVAVNGSGGHNMFMVGDVKQSIYRFRMACPELFMEKYKSFDSFESNTQKIDLHKNFRSRREVLDFSNDIFYKLMSPDLGDVGYDEDAALYMGADYPENPDAKAEVLYFDLSQEMMEGLSDEDLSKHQLEARMVADKIKDMMAHLKVTDSKTKELRNLRFGDIVILFRSLRGWGEDFAETLTSCGIPAHVELQTGYFSAIEVQTVLNMLRILDNPYQDIPMAAVLHSPMVGLSDEELAELRVSDESIPFSAAAFHRMEQAFLQSREKEEGLSEIDGKLADFYTVYKKLRSKKDVPIRDLIYQVLRETGYGAYAASLPAGEKRAANLNMLLEKASAYEKTSYKGLFHFVRYVDQIKKYEIDEGEADVIGENADVVHIMTIHKSKGLEFPVVFVSGLSKQFNLRDTAEIMVLHPKLGMGISEMTAKPRTKRASLYKTQIAEQIKRESIGEELRVLYVALTRAKEKLILTGTITAEDKLSDYTGNTKEKQPLSFLSRGKAKSYTDWILPAVLSYPDKYGITFVKAAELVQKDIEVQVQKLDQVNEVFRRIKQADQTRKDTIAAELSYRYPYQNERNKKSKYSVSELKHASMAKRYDESEQEAERPDFLLEEREHFVPKFAKSPENEDERISPVYGVSRGALRGTAVHRVMECLDFVKMNGIDSKDGQAVKAFVRDELFRMSSSNELTREMRELIYPSMIEEFVKSETASRMAKAAAAGKLYKEKPFVMEHEGVLVQGIIDVFWEEDNSLVVLDYKTDRVAQAGELVLRYKTQLELYADALTRIFSTKEKEWNTKEALLYSFHLKEVVRL